MSYETKEKAQQIFFQNNVYMQTKADKNEKLSIAIIYSNNPASFFLKSKKKRAYERERDGVGRKNSERWGKWDR